jgi:hypothetical protein
MNEVKTGEVFDRDENGLWLCESFEDSDTKEVFTTRTLVEPPQE